MNARHLCWIALLLSACGWRFDEEPLPPLPDAEVADGADADADPADATDAVASADAEPPPDAGLDADTEPPSDAAPGPDADGDPPPDAGADAAPPGADADPPEADAGPPSDESGELRGIWITRFAFRTADALEGIIDRAADAGFNAVFVQIRGEGDAWYHSTREPWARGLTGTLGRDPGWDPLQVALDRAHARGLEMHAYFNVFSAWSVGAGPLPDAEGPVPHPLRAHPEWTAVNAAGDAGDAEYLWFTPGDPALRAHIAATAAELLTDYAVDGLHLDRIRTSGRAYSYDPATRAAFAQARQADPDLTLEAFVPAHMTESVNAMVAELYAVIAETRPAVKLSAAVWGIYDRASLGDCQGGVSQGRPDYNQDSLAWMREGTIDALVPMMYWPLAEGRCTDYARLLDVFLRERAGRHVWGGSHALDINAGNAWDFPALVDRIEHGRAAGAHGVVIFASTYLDREAGGWDGFAAPGGPFEDPDRIPDMPWK